MLSVSSYVVLPAVDVVVPGVDPLVNEPVAEVSCVPSALVYTEEPEPCDEAPLEPVVCEPVAEVECVPSASVYVDDPEP